MSGRAFAPLEWFTPAIPRAEFKTYLARDNWHGAIYYGAWLLALAGMGTLAALLYPGWAAIPAFLLYGLVYSGNNARWHETSHGTAFKADWPNALFYWLCGAMEFRDPVEFRWSHSTHHSQTIVTGVDPEIPLARPPSLLAFFSNAFYLAAGFHALGTLVLHSLGIVTKKARTYVPADEYRSLFWSARSVLLPQLLAVGLALGLQSWLPVLLWGLPRFYGGFVVWMFTSLQHAGLAENVPDHRLTTRSFRFGPLLSFFVLRMEAHVEHHMFPLVPFHALPRLRKRLASELPEPYPGLVRPFLELLPVLFRQRKDPGVQITRPLPRQPIA